MKNKIFKIKIFKSYILVFAYILIAVFPAVSFADSGNLQTTTFGGRDYFIDETTHCLYRTYGGITEPVLHDYSVFGIYQVDNALYASALNRVGDTEVVLRLFL